MSFFTRRNHALASAGRPALLRWSRYHRIFHPGIRETPSAAPVVEPTTQVAPQISAADKLVLADGATKLRRLPQLPRLWLWLVVPLLAIVSYGSVLGIGFLADDFSLLFEAQIHDLGLQSLLPTPTRFPFFFYRPIGNLLVWDLGYRLWGANPLPYHLVGLLVHAITSLLLALWTTEATRNRRIGLLSGAIFAVFPLHLEAVGWVAAQWDAWSALFLLLSLWLFTRWWRKAGSGWIYGLALLSFVVAVFTKESALTFLPIFALSTFLVDEGGLRRKWARLALYLLPFLAAVMLNLTIRLIGLGQLGGYSWMRKDYENFTYEYLLKCLQVLLAPVNSLALNSAVVQLVGLTSLLLLLTGLVLYGYRHRRLLVVGAAWIFFAIGAALTVPPIAFSLQQNRYLYLAVGGYAIIVAALLVEAISRASRRLVLVSSIVVGIAAAITLCWIQLGSWRTATVLANDLDRQLNRMIPVTQQTGRAMWYLQGVPSFYQGAYMLHTGINEMRHLSTSEWPDIRPTDAAGDIDLTKDSGDAFALRFKYDEATAYLQLDYASGITGKAEPPSSESTTTHISVWDFRSCDSAVRSAWNVDGANAACKPGDGLRIHPLASDAALISNELSLPPGPAHPVFVRLAVSMSVSSTNMDGQPVGEWFWMSSSDSTFTAQHDSTRKLKSDDQPHVYWTYLPVSQIPSLKALRFDPVNSSADATVQWISVDLVY